MLLYLGFVRYFILGKKEFDFLHSVIYVNTRMFFLDKSHSLKCTQNFSVVMSQVGKVYLLTNFICFFFIYGQFSSLFVATNSRTARAPNLITLYIKFWWGFLRFFSALSLLCVEEILLKLQLSAVGVWIMVVNLIKIKNKYCSSLLQWLWKIDKNL